LLLSFIKTIVFLFLRKNLIQIIQMVDYKIVKHCRLCRKRFVVNKGESKRIYCDECKLKIENQDNDMEEVK